MSDPCIWHRPIPDERLRYQPCLNDGRVLIRPDMARFWPIANVWASPLKAPSVGWSGVSYRSRDRAVRIAARAERRLR